MIDKDFRGGTYQRRIYKPQGKTQGSRFMWIFSCEVKHLRINGISGFLSNDEKFHLIWTLALLSFTNASEPFVLAPYGKAHLFIHMLTNDSPWSLIFKRLLEKELFLHRQELLLIWKLEVCLTFVRQQVFGFLCYWQWFTTGNCCIPA